MYADKFQKMDSHPFDECNNAFTKPKPPRDVTYMLKNLQKAADYENSYFY